MSSRSGSRFMLAGLRPVEVESPVEGAALLSRLAERPEVGLVLVEDSIHQSLNEDTRRDLARRPLPMVVPFPRSLRDDGRRRVRPVHRGVAAPCDRLPGEAPVNTPRIRRITGTLVEVSPAGSAGLYELARVGERGLLGEVIRLSHDTATLQVYEETAGFGSASRYPHRHLALDHPGTRTARIGPRWPGAAARTVAGLSGDFIAPASTAPLSIPSGAGISLPDFSRVPR
jgi:vacuolar-type H+-ATPase subunit F/Vma7